MANKPSEEIPPTDRCPKCNLATAPATKGDFANCGQCDRPASAIQPVVILLPPKIVEVQFVNSDPQLKRETKQVS